MMVFADTWTKDAGKPASAQADRRARRALREEARKCSRRIRRGRIAEKRAFLFGA